MYRIRYLMPWDKQYRYTGPVELIRALEWGAKLKWHLGAVYAFVVDA